MAVLKANGSFLKANGKILVRPEGVGDFVVIGGKKYPFVQIGRQLWIVYNLDYSDANIPIGGGLSSSVPKAYYYDQDEATNGWNGRKNNLLYNVPALNYLVQNSSTIFPNGWRVCSNSDMESLIKFGGGALVAGIKLAKGDLDWQSASWNGTDDFGFSWLPSGARWASDGGFQTIGEEAALYTSNNRMYYTLGDGVILFDTEHGPASSVPIRICKDATVNIGGRDYPTTKIGNQIWLAENLDYKFEGCNIGASSYPSTPAAWYYNNDEATYGATGRKCGLLYNWYAAKYLDDNRSDLLPKGWRVPTREDISALVNYAGGVNTAGTKLKAKDGSILSNFPSNWSGTDDYGMSIIPSGTRDHSSFYRDNTRMFIWTSTDRDGGLAYTRDIYPSANVSNDNTGDYMYNGNSVRLVKDA